jgi:hypothetical protein
MTLLAHGQSQDTKAVLDSSAACPTIFALHATDCALRLTARSRLGHHSLLLEMLIHDMCVIKVCLFDSKEVSLRDEMRSGASDADLFRTIKAAVYGKQEKHVEMEDIDVVTNRPMILIGG